MANRYPLIADKDSQEIRELPIGDDLDLSGNNVSSVRNIIPENDSTYDLGSPTKKWNSLYVSGATVIGILKIDDGVHEKFQELADATGIVEHDCSSGHIFYHTSPDANWTVNLINLNLESDYATSITIVVAQGGTDYYPNALQIGGAAQTINWQGGAAPTPGTNGVDVVTFSILNNGPGAYIVLGQLTDFRTVA